MLPISNSPPAPQHWPQAYLVLGSDSTICCIVGVGGAVLGVGVGDTSCGIQGVAACSDGIRQFHPIVQLLSVSES